MLSIAPSVPDPPIVDPLIPKMDAPVLNDPPTETNLFTPSTLNFVKSLPVPLHDHDNTKLSNPAIAA
jgi:hypothetical protein